MTESEVIKLLGMVYSAYPNMKEVTKTTVSLWYECLKDMDVKDGLAAVKKHILESPYPPTIADIREVKTAKKTRFHNFEQRSDKYTAKELEEIARKKREKYYLKLQDWKKVLSLESKIKEG